MATKRARTHPTKAAGDDLREACVAAARAAIESEGLENLSLREVARRLGVSHQAPYKHFPSRDHLLAEVLGRCFGEFSRFLDGRERSDVPMEDLAALGRRYLEYALGHPLEYRLMFGTPWPEAAGRESLLPEARHAFDILRQVLERQHFRNPNARELAERDAIFVWSTMHGIASIVQSGAMRELSLRPAVLRDAVAHVMDRIAGGLLAPGRKPPTPGPRPARARTRKR